MEPQGALGPRITGVEHEVEAIRKKAKEMEAKMSAENHSGNQNFSTLSINAGGVGVWIATTACIAMLCAMLIGALWISREMTRMDARAAEQEVKLDRANTFLSAIWANAPELEKKVKAEQEKENSRAK
jgi:hypothetical protein